MSEEKKGSFKLKKKTYFSQIENDQVKELPESDLCFQNEEFIAQFDYIEPSIDKKDIIKPGTYELTETSLGVKTKKIELKKYQLLKEIGNTSTIIKEARTFFDRLHIYEKVKKPKKRGVLLYSKPGMGKTSAISEFCNDFVKEDSGTVVINWPTSEVEAKRVSKFLSVYTEYAKECTRLILIIEDIGGGEYENYGRANQVDSGLLNLLDGVNVAFKLPTFIVATTNHPENLLAAIADRPGRFDLMLELKPPTLEEKIKLLEFRADRNATQEEKDSLAKESVKNFSAAHIDEIVIRSLLHDKTISEVIDEFVEHGEKMKRSFAEEKSIKIGIN